METLSLNVNLENLTTEERDNLMKLVEKSQEKSSKVWKPKISKRFYVISTCGTLGCRTWQDDVSCNNLFEIGNVFCTLEAAEEELTRRKMLTKWKRLSIESGEDENQWDNINGHWTVCYNHASKKLDTSTVMHNCKYEEVYFSTKASLLDAIKELGEDNVKKYILNIK